jgi:hypothetical protein
MNIRLLFISLFFAFGLAAQTVTIPDQGFLSSLIQLGFDKNNDAQIQQIEAEEIDSLNLETRSVSFYSQYFSYERTIESLDGIEAFTNLRYLNINNRWLEFNGIATNVPTEITINHKNITTIDLSKNLFLETLLCNGNQLKTLDLSANTRLKDFYFIRFSS